MARAKKKISNSQIGEKGLKMGQRWRWLVVDHAHRVAIAKAYSTASNGREIQCARSPSSDLTKHAVAYFRGHLLGAYEPTGTSAEAEALEGSLTTQVRVISSRML